MTLMNTEEWNKGIELRKVYDEEFRPLLSKKKYNDAFEFLLKNPEIKSYLELSEIHAMYSFVESKYSSILAICKKINEAFDNLNELKGLEGRTKVDNGEIEESAGTSWGDSR